MIIRNFTCGMFKHVDEFNLNLLVRDVYRANVYIVRNYRFEFDCEDVVFQE